MDKPTDNVTRLATIAKMMEDGNWHSSAKVVLAAADEIERLRAERDEARRETCYELSGWKQSTHEQEARAEAERRGWDCFDKDGNA